VPANVNAIAAAIIAACAVITLCLRIAGADVTAATPWWAITVAAVSIVALIVNLGAILYRFTRGTAQSREFPSDFMAKIERLCADEHEISLSMSAGNAKTALPRRDYFRGVIEALEEPCRELGLSITLKAISVARKDFATNLASEGAYHAFNDVSQALKRELPDKWRLVRA